MLSAIYFEPVSPAIYPASGQLEVSGTLDCKSCALNVWIHLSPTVSTNLKWLRCNFMFLCLHRVRTHFWIQNSSLFPDTNKAHAVALQKEKLKTFYHFSRLSLFFSRLFPGLENCWANFKTFKNSRLCMNLVT